MPHWNESLQHNARGLLAAILLAGMATGCRPEKKACDRCDILVVAATGEPSTLIPPLVRETVGRDVSDYIYEKLANLKPGGVPSDSAAYSPGLAIKWEPVDSVTWRFTLRPGAKWHDGQPVTPDDVIFTYAAYADTALGSPGGAALDGVTVTADGSDKVLIRFPRPSADALLDATWGVRIMPKRIWDPIPRAQWGTDSSLAQLIGSGPFKVTEWQRGQTLRLERVDPNGGAVKQIIWRFATDQDAALNLILAGEADLLETATSPAARERAGKDTTVVLRPYPSALYGFLGFRHADAQGKPHPILSDVSVRRALGLAIDRPTLVKAVLGPEAAIPGGPMSRALWLWTDGAGSGPDVARANQLLDSLGWRSVNGGGTRSKGGRKLAIEILFPSTSGIRRQLAEGIQQMWKAVGVEATLTGVDFPVFQQRLGQGRFDTMIGASLDEPGPRGLVDQWTKSGWGSPNQIRYSNTRFDSLANAALAARTPDQARTTWQQAIKVLDDDVAAVFLYTPTNVAVAAKRYAAVTIDPFSWLSQVAK